MELILKNHIRLLKDIVNDYDTELGHMLARRNAIHDTIRHLEELQKYREENVKHKCIILDFSKAVHSENRPWRTNDISYGPPKEGALEFIIEAIQSYEIYIYDIQFTDERIALAKKWFKSRLCLDKDGILSKLHFIQDVSDVFVLEEIPSTMQEILSEQLYNYYPLEGASDNMTDKTKLITMELE